MIRRFFFKILKLINNLLLQNDSFLKHGKTKQFSFANENGARLTAHERFGLLKKTDFLKIGFIE